MGEWLRTGEAAEPLGVTTRDVLQLIEEGRLAGRRVVRFGDGSSPRGRRVDVSAASVQRFIDDEGDDGLAGVPARV